jgi:hypothetical protein
VITHTRQGINTPTYAHTSTQPKKRPVGECNSEIDENEVLSPPPPGVGINGSAWNESVSAQNSPVDHVSSVVEINSSVNVSLVNDSIACENDESASDGRVGTVNESVSSVGAAQNDAKPGGGVYDNPTLSVVLEYGWYSAKFLYLAWKVRLARLQLV